MAGKPNQLVLEPEDEEDTGTDLREDLEIDEPEIEPEEEPEAPPVRHQETALEKQARQLGWHPQSEYRGPPGQWKDAKTFMEHGQNILPVLRDNLKRALDAGVKQADELAQVKQSMAEQAQALKEMREMARTAGERSYKQAIADMETERRAAVAAGDTEAYDEVSQKIKAAEAEREKAIPPKESPTPPANRVPQEVLDFVNSNPWYNEDAELNREMQAAHVYLKTKSPGQSLADNLAEAKSMVAKAFPEKFGRSNGARPPANNGRAPVSQPTGGRSGQQPRRQEAGGIDSIEDPGEKATAKRVFANMKRQFPDYTEEEYMASFQNPHGDILAIQKSLKEKRRGK